jgi:Zn-dependent peptidase ImmA (M78 family)
MSMVSPRALAREKLLDFYNTQSTALGHKLKSAELFPVDLTKFAAPLLQDGWKISSLPDLREMDRPISGRSDFERKIILVNSTDVARERFTLAHEFGHVLLKHEGCRHFRDDHGPRSILRPEQLEPPDPAVTSREREADAFASELLMPERAVRREFKQRFLVDRLWTRSTQAHKILGVIYNRAADAASKLAVSSYQNSEKCLSDFFGVSPSAMRIRLLELGLVY